MNSAVEPKVVGFGDSITCGAKATGAANCWLGVVEGLLRLFLRSPPRVHNEGVGDNTISPRTTNYAESSKPSALERVDRIVALRPDLVFVCFGLNDMRFGTPIGIFAEDLDTIVGRMRKALPSSLLLLTNVFYMNGWNRYAPRNCGSPDFARAYNAAIATVAETRNVPLVDVWSAMGMRDDLVHEDGVHANDLGHRLIGHRVFETLATQTDFLLRHGRASFPGE
jgi:acyl-CoA thioesterase-1